MKKKSNNSSKRTNKLIKIINYILLIIMCVGSFFLMIYRVSQGILGRVPTDIAIYFVLLIPVILKRFIKIGEKDKLEFYIFIFIAEFLGCIVNLFKYISWFDTFSHFVSGIYFFIIGLKVLRIINKYDEKNVFFNILFAIAISLSSACIWEIFEFSIDNLFNMNLQHNIDTGVIDTMKDIIACTTGAFISVLSYYFYRKKVLK